MKDFCYCDQCRKPLTPSRAVDYRYAWCPDCGAVVAAASCQMRPWVLGVLVVIFSNYIFQLWA